MGTERQSEPIPSDKPLNLEISPFINLNQIFLWSAHDFYPNSIFEQRN